MPIDPKPISAYPELTSPADGDLLPVVDVSASTPAAKNKRMTLATLKAWVAGMTNPMTTAGDLIVGGESGAPARLAKGADGQILKMVSGALAWVAEATGFSNPMTTAGDIIVGGTSGAAARLGKGANGQVLKIVDNAPAWATDATGGDGGGGMTNPMTTAADLIIGGVSGAPVRLGKGTNGQVLKIVDDAIAWAEDEEGEGGGSALPVADTTALVKDPVTATKQIRIDAGNVPDDTTVVLQSPGVSAEVGTIVIERSFSGAPLSPGYYEGVFIAVRSGRMVAVGASVSSTGGTYPVAIRIRKNEVNQGAGPMLLNNTANGGYGRYTRGSLAFTLSAGDIVGVDIVGAGADDIGGSGSTGSNVEGTLVVQFEMVFSPALD